MGGVAHRRVISAPAFAAVLIAAMILAAPRTSLAQAWGIYDDTVQPRGTERLPPRERKTNHLPESRGPRAGPEMPLLTDADTCDGRSR
jgi:hypothetical protein